MSFTVIGKAMDYTNYSKIHKYHFSNYKITEIHFNVPMTTDSFDHHKCNVYSAVTGGLAHVTLVIVIV